MRLQVASVLVAPPLACARGVRRSRRPPGPAHALRAPLLTLSAAQSAELSGAARCELLAVRLAAAPRLNSGRSRLKPSTGWFCRPSGVAAHYGLVPVVVVVVAEEPPLLLWLLLDAATAMTPTTAAMPR